MFVLTRYMASQLFYNCMWEVFHRLQLTVSLLCYTQCGKNLFFYPLVWRKCDIDQPAGSNTASVCFASLMLMLTSRLPRSPFSNKGFSSEHGTFILYFPMCIK